MSKFNIVLASISFLFGAYNGIILPVGYKYIPEASGLIEMIGIILVVILINIALLYYNNRKGKKRISSFSKLLEKLHVNYFLAPCFIAVGIFGLLSTLIRGAESVFYLGSLFSLLGGVLFSMHFVELYFANKK